jgi:membrane protein implicated in regulation of membrane protease activity
MTFTSFYLVCLLGGFALSVLLALSGMSHFHIPGLHHHPIHARSGGSFASAFNLGTIAGFLMWFGAAGLLLSTYSRVWSWLAFVLATGAGLAGATVLFLFLTRVLLAHEQPLLAEDYEMAGVLGTLSYAIREGGTGEVTFSQGGTRRSAAARSEEGVAMAKHTEVVVMRYEKGIAYVRPWNELNETKETI